MCTLCVWLLLFNKTLLDFFIILLCKSAACLCFSTLYGSVTVYSSFHWWTVVLFPCFRYCEQYWYNHLHINLYKDVFFISLRCIDRIYLLNYLLIFKVFFPRNNQTLLQSRGGTFYLSVLFILGIVIGLQCYLDVALICVHWWTMLNIFSCVLMFSYDLEKKSIQPTMRFDEFWKLSANVLFGEITFQIF